MSQSRERIAITSAHLPFFAGVDVGGTNIKIGLVDDQGSTLGQTSIPTEEPKGPADAIARVKKALDGLLAETQITWGEVAAVGLGTPRLRRHNGHIHGVLD